MAKLTSGDAAPEFALPDQHGQTVRLTDFGGQCPPYILTAAL